MKHVIIFSSYPVKNPQHGGQKRLEAIIAAYKKAGMKVLSISVTAAIHYTNTSRNDISVSKDTVRLIEKSPYFSDIICGEAIAKDRRVKNKILSKISSFKPNIIHIEQVYSYMGLKDLLDEIDYQGILINGTQNIEYAMKDAIYKSVGMPQKTVKESTDKIKHAETQLALASNVNVAVSEDDAAQLSLMGAKNIILAPNGMNKKTISDSTVTKWKNHYKSRHIDRIAIFVGSAHEPNASGFMQMIGRQIGFVPINHKIIVVGGVSDLIKNRLNPEAIEDICFTQRVDLLGRVSEQDLNALIDISDVVLLPITEGGGSNLKTAEALLSGKYIVSTAHAFRGYDRFLSLPTVQVAKTQDEFRVALVECMQKGQITLSNEQKELISEVEWDHCLGNFVKMLVDYA